MKRLFFVILTVIFDSLQLFAGNSELFSYNSDEAEAVMQDLKHLEQYVESTPNISLSDMLASGNSLVEGISKTCSSLSFMASMQPTENPMGIPSYMWGCCLSLSGVLIVFMLTDEQPDHREEVRKAMKGCIVGAVAPCSLYLILLALNYQTY